MPAMNGANGEVDDNGQAILTAAAQHNIPLLRDLLRQGSASVQEESTGRTPLHAAIAACRADPKEPNGHFVPNATNGLSTPDSKLREDAAAETVRILLQNGAIWNDVDLQYNETPGCLALRLGLDGLYEIMVDAGVRAELLLNRLDEYHQLEDVSDDELETRESVDQTMESSEGQEMSHEHRNTSGCEQADAVTKSIDSSHSRGMGALGSRSANTAIDPEQSTEQPPSVPCHLENHQYLASDVSFHGNRIVDSAGHGIMMDWESDIMKRSAEKVCVKPGQRVLNIGHGMGILDDFFQEHSPAEHHIIEAHPAVLEQMRKTGWFDKPGVIVHAAKWQDILPQLIAKGDLFDAIYFDTFAEDYRAFHKLFDEFLIGLLDDEGRWSFFNGLGADRQICYDVYTKVVEMDLYEAGFQVEWEIISVPEMTRSEDWKGIVRPYWTLKEYKLPRLIAEIKQ